MDWNQLKDSVSNLTLYDVKAGVRKVQNAVMNYTEMEAKVREATNNEPWGASSSLMQEIANGTFNYANLNEIMPMIYRRFTEKSAEEWRQIYKALQLLEFLIKHGSERVIDDARGHITLLKMLRQFHYIDQNGKDQGVNVRNRAKELAELLGDVERIRSERKKARATKNKYTGVEGGMGLGGGFSSGAGGSRYGGFGSETGGYGGYSGGVYGDGGGFGGEESNDFSRTQAHNDKFEEYDEFDEGSRPAASSSASRSKRPERAAAAPKAEPPKKKEPEVDLFSFDDPAPSSVPAPAVAPTSSASGSGFAPLSAAPAAANDDDEFDDFQSATPATTSAPAATPLSRPVMTSSANSATTFAAPQPVSAPQQANLGNMVSMSSMSPAPSGPNYSAFSAPAMASPASQAPQPSGYQPSGPNYFGSVQAPPAQAAGGSFGGASGGMAASKPAAAKPAAAGGDAFGALWSQASVGVKKTSTPTAGPAMGQLVKEKSSAGIWGAPAAASPAPKPAGSSSGGNHGLDDLLG